MNAEIYTKDNCSYCVRAKDLFKKHNIGYKGFIISPGFGERKLEENQVYTTREDLLEKAPLARTVPQIWLDGNYIGGYTELEAFFLKTSL
jgi:glutaredoxin 3